jgi:hypothetical protein
VNQEGEYIYETEIKRIQSLMGVNAVNEQIRVDIGGLLGPFGGAPGMLKTYSWVKTWNAHDWLTFVDITSGLLGMIPSPASGVFLGVSTAACLADGGLYLYEDDPYMGGLVLSFCLIPAGELALMSPRIARSIAKGKKHALDTIKKAKELAKKRTLTTAEKAIMEEAAELMAELQKNATKIAKLTQKNLVTKFVANVVAKGGKAILGTALLLSKMSWAIGRPIVQLGGIYYTFDEIYLALYGTDEQKMQLRYNSGFQQLVRFLKLLANREKAVEEASKYIQGNTAQMEEHSGELVTVDHEKQENNIQQFQQATVKSLNKEQEEKERAPSFELVLSKKIDPITKKPYVIREGLKGASVGKIQQMLEKLGYGETLRGYDSNEKKKAVDYDFGKNTYDAVGLFQGDNNLKFTGIVDYETLKTLQIKFKELENTNEKKDTN